MFDLPHVASRLYGTPLLVARPKLETILAALTPRLTGISPAMSSSESEARVRGSLRITPAGIAMIPILGTLVRRSSHLAAQSGLTSYHEIEAEAQEAFTNPAVRGVLLEIDSSGGEAGGVFDLSESLRAMAESTGKPLWAVADECALSAAYALACAAEHITVTRTAEVGSVGVVAVHVDESGADSQAGLVYTFIHAGMHKVDGNPHEPLPASVREREQADVDAMHSQFVALVAARRKCSPDAVRATEAAIFRGQDAVNAGFADSVGTLQQTHAAFCAALDASTDPEIPIPLVPDAVPTRAAIEMEICTRLDALSDIAAQAQRLGIEVDPVKALREGISPDTLTQHVLREAAARDACDTVLGIAPAPISSSAPTGGNALLHAVNTLSSKGVRS